MDRTDALGDRVSRDNSPPQMIHLVRHEDDVIALCGKPCTGPVMGDDAPVDCVVCADLDPARGSGGGSSDDYDGFLELCDIVPAPAPRRALRRSGIRSLLDASAWTRAELRRLPGVGAGTVNQLETALRERGLALRGEDTR